MQLPTGPYMSMLELWMIKTGRIQQNIEEESEGHAPLYWGKRLEPLVAEYYSMHTNYKVRRVNAVLQHSDPDKHFMLANLDYSVVGDADVQILSVKPRGVWCQAVARWRAFIRPLSGTTPTGRDRQESRSYLHTDLWA